MINPRVSALNKSATLKITALTKKLIKEGKDVVNFAAGEPDFDTPDFIKAQAKQAIDQGFTKYTPSAGTPNLRQLIAAKLKSENNISFKESNIIVTSGAKYAIYVALLSLLDIGDEVILPAPYWVSYPEMLKLCGAKPIFLETDEEDNFKISPEKLKNSITDKTKVLILNYPANPTGATYSRAELEAIAEVIADKNIFVISDEIYEVLTYDGLKHTSFGSLPGMEDLTVTINGCSKTFSMTGWRIGYLAAADEIISQASKIIDHTTSCACSISQRAAAAAFKDQEWKNKVRQTFCTRRNQLFSGLKTCDKILPLKPQGTFYLFCDIRRTNLTSFDFASQLLNQQLVSCIPASAFGKEGFVRISFATSQEQIQKGLERIKQFLGD